MDSKAKEPKRPGRIRLVLGDNIATALKRQFPGDPVSTAERKLAALAGVGHGTIQRMRKAQAGSSIDNIEFVAEALGVTINSLLTPSAATRRALNIDQEPADDDSTPPKVSRLRGGRGLPR